MSRVGERCPPPVAQDHSEYILEEVARYGREVSPHSGEEFTMAGPPLSNCPENADMVIHRSRSISPTHSQCSSYRVAILRFWKRRSTGPEPELHRQMIMWSERVSARISPTHPENSNTLPSPPLSCFYVVISSPVVFTNVRKIVVMLAPHT